MKNAFFVDDMYTARVIYSGLILDRPGSNTASVTDSDAMLSERLAAGKVEQQPDRFWSVPRDAPEWAMVKSNVMGRMRVAAFAVSISNERIQAAQALKDDIETERAR